MTYDTARRRVQLVLSSDLNESQIVLRSYDGNTWTDHGGGVPASIACSIAFDEARGRLVYWASGARRFREWNGQT